MDRKNGGVAGRSGRTSEKLNILVYTVDRIIRRENHP
jgi:hypothetical protein